MALQQNLGFYGLPVSIQGYIYEFDPTFQDVYKSNLKHVMEYAVGFRIIHGIRSCREKLKEEHAIEWQDPISFVNNTILTRACFQECVDDYEYLISLLKKNVMGDKSNIFRKSFHYIPDLYCQFMCVMFPEFFTVHELHMIFSCLR